MDPSTPLTEVFRLAEVQKRGLKKLKLETARDLLFHFPFRYVEPGAFRQVAELKPGETALLQGKISNLKIRRSFRRKVPLGEADFEDLSGKIKIIWFNQPYLAKMTVPGQIVQLAARVARGRKGLYLANPEIRPAAEEGGASLFGPGETLSLLPIYSETRGLSSRWFYHAVRKIFKSGLSRKIADYIPEEILKKYNLPTLKTALIWIHSPRKKNDAEAARKRFAFEEVFFIQLARGRTRAEYRRHKTFSVKINKVKLEKFLERFPFTPTRAQRRVLFEILKDLSATKPMARLLEGDVGSGKTAVAATAAYAVVINRPDGKNFGNLQIAYMAPTEILAVQHFESFIKYFAHLPVQVGLITGKTCRKFPSKVNPHSWTDISRAQLLKWAANGEISILFGTHALIQKSVKFKNLALAIIDEQHRFGTAQREKLMKKDSDQAPHLLSMTATPIPRTLALTVYGDLDLSLLDELPPGRREPVTEIVPPASTKLKPASTSRRRGERGESENRGGVYEKIRREIEAGRQVFVICPRIEEPDPAKELALQAKSAIAEAKRLKKEVFPDERIEVLHGKLAKQKKEAVMRDFAGGRIQILVSTSVVEVGVNVPNATVIVIEGADRFGLAQLHQLRGRVLRSEHQAYCYLFTESKSQKTMDRLKAMRTAKNGFELAEMDLSLRGAGELAGDKQWGLSDMGMEALKNLKMVEAARAEAQALLAADPELKDNPLLSEMFKHRHREIHFE